MKKQSLIFLLFILIICSCTSSVPEGKYILKNKRGLQSLLCGASWTNLGKTLEIRGMRIVTTPMKGITGNRIYEIKKNEHGNFFITIQVNGKESNDLEFELSEYKEILFKCEDEYVIYEFSHGFIR